MSAAYYRHAKKPQSPPHLSLLLEKSGGEQTLLTNSASRFINKEPCGSERKDEGGEQRWCLEKQRGSFLVESLPESGLRIKASAG